MDAVSQSEVGSGKSLGWLGKTGLVLCVVWLVAIGLVRWAAPDLDFALANILTVGLALLTWLSMCVVLTRSALPRLVWRLWFAAPFVLFGVGWACLELERVDGELRPQFRLRWRAQEALPTATTNVAPSGLSTAESPTDFPQFLGPLRDGRLPNVMVEEDWTQHPPEIRWKQTIGDGWSGFAVQGDLAITMEQRDEQEWITAYSIDDGALQWYHAIDGKHTDALGGTGPRSTPAIHDNHVYACSAVSQLVCLELESGNLIWSYDLLEAAEATQEEFEAAVTWGRSGSPLIVDGRVVMPLGGAAGSAQTLLALDANTGQQLWRSGDDQISYSSPMLVELGGIPQILLISEKKLAAYAPDSGAELWSTPWPSNSNGDASVSQPVVLEGQRLLLSKGYGQGAQVIEVVQEADQWSVNTVWTSSRVLKTKFTSCVVREGYAYGLSDGILECVDLSTGKRAWKKGRYRQGQLLLVGKHLLVSAEIGTIVLVAADPAEFRELATLPVIGDVTWNTLTLSGNRLLVRNSDDVACVHLPLVETEETSESTGDGAEPEEAL